MSVRCEGLMFVIRRQTLDQSYPGGSKAMIDWLSKSLVGSQWVVSDEHLVAVHVDLDDFEEALEQLQGCGLELFSHEEEAPRYMDFAIVDGSSGPTQTCDWLEWDGPSHQGHSRCWLAGIWAKPLGLVAHHYLSQPLNPAKTKRDT
jgi:hypothetical protein